MVRYHGQVSPPSDKDSSLTDVDREDLDRFWKLVAAMKKEGIYTTIDPYWSRSVGKIPASWNIDGAAGHDASGLLFFDKQLQAGYKSWLRALFTEKNPYTGLPLKDDTSVALIQLQNEDSLLFYTAQGIKGAPLERLRALYGDFLVKKHGSLEKARSAWGTPLPGGEGEEFQEKQGDEPEKGRMGIYITWELTQTPGARGGDYRSKRLADQLQFLGETMHRFNSEMVQFLREDLGCKQLINGGNWKTADPVKLEDVERWSYTSTDIIGMNRYFDTVHFGPRTGSTFDVGDHFTNNTAVLEPRSLPMNVRQVSGFPFMIFESHWVPPTKYQSEGPMLTAAYQALTGQDSFYWFALGDTDEWQGTGDKWRIGTPMEMGQFPAAALMFRAGYVQQGRAVVRENRTLEQLWNREEPLIAEDPSFDPNRDAARGGASTLRSGVDPLAFLVGPVEVRYGDKPGLSELADLSKFIDNNNKTVRSITGELMLDYGQGLFTANTPKAQGATGFLKKAGLVKTEDITIQAGNDYASILAVSLDSLPLKTSSRVLVQIGTTMRPKGWQDKDATFQSPDKKITYVGKQIVNTGENSWQVEQGDATISIGNALLKTATALDVNGMETGKIDVTREGEQFSFKMPADALYVVLQ